MDESLDDTGCSIACSAWWSVRCIDIEAGLRRRAGELVDKLLSACTVLCEVVMTVSTLKHVCLPISDSMNTSILSFACHFVRR